MDYQPESVVNVASVELIPLPFASNGTMNALYFVPSLKLSIL